MKLFSKISMMALAALAFAACSQEDFTNDVNPTPEQGEKTWAYFSFSFKESMTRAGVGNEDAQGNEAKINRAAIYIFKADGSFEVKADGEANNNHIPSVAVEVTSGVKTIVAVLNDNQKDDRATTGTTLNAFLAQVETAKTTTLYNADTDGIVDMLMTGQKIATLLPNVSQEDAESNSNTSNHVQLSVDRVAAKLDVTSTKLNVGTLGNLKGLSYNVLNLHKTPYTVLQTVDAKGVIPTPFYAETVSDIYAGYYYKNTNEDLTTSYSLIKEGETTNTANVYGSTVVYLPENTNVVPQKGNSSYVFLKSTFVPNDSKFASFSGNKISMNEELVAPTVASSSMYSYDYDFTFQPVAGTAYDDTQIKQLIAHHIVANYPVYATSLNINDITTTAATAATVGTNKFVYTIGKATNDPSNGKTCTTITVKRYLPNGDNAPIEDAKFSVKDLTVGSYVWDNANKGLICYYRINIFDKDKAKTDAMYFSVIRNNAYHVNITGVSSIGYPEPGDVTVEPETPLIDFPTYMQVEITINQWTSKDMNTEIGM